MPDINEIGTEKRYPGTEFRKDLFSSLAESIHAAAPLCRKILLVSDENVFSLYGLQAATALSPFVLSNFTVQPGERSKSITNYAALLEAAAEAELCKNDLIVVLGGGVPGDLGGFAAATYMRGIGCVQIPTSLLAMVDSAVGGKSGIDLPKGKNLAGAIVRPLAVLSDLRFLSTLPPEEYTNGLGEIFKYAVLEGGELFDSLEKDPSFAASEKCISACVRAKLRYVGADEYDRGVRRLLNLGHTVGHAIEARSGYTISHGRAVAMGLLTLTEASYASGILGAKDCARIAALGEKLGFEGCPYAPEELLSYMRADKKRTGDSAVLVLPQAIGHCVMKEFSERELESFFGG